MSKMNCADLAEGIDEMREALQAAVAAMVEDGFTEREARVILAGSFAALTKKAEEENR